MATPRDTTTEWLILVQGRMLEALAEGDTMLTGATKDLAHQLGLSQRDLRTCLHQLEGAGWITVRQHHDGRLIICFNHGPSDAAH